MRSLTNIFILSASLLSIGNVFRTYGYSYFNTDEGENALCDIDPTCRKLTTSEIDIARAYFGDTINYTTVNMYSGYPWRLQFLLQTRRDHVVASSSAGQIYVPENFWDYDRNRRISIYLHEQMHVWQYQNDAPYNADETGYDYDFPLSDNIADYGKEQQAEIVDDLYLNRTALPYLNDPRDTNFFLLPYH